MGEGQVTVKLEFREVDGYSYLPSVSYDDVVEGCVTLAEAGEADFDDHVAERGRAGEDNDGLADKKLS